MSVHLGPNQYGKAETRLVRVVRDGDRHDLTDINVSVALAGDLDGTHLRGDNAAVLPTAFVSTNAPVPDHADPAAVEASPVVIAKPLDGGGQSYTGTADAPGTAVVAQQFDAGWRVENGGEVLAPFAGYGWAIAAPVQAGSVDVRFTDQWLRTIELYLLALLWIIALWVTRKPGSA